MVQLFEWSLEKYGEREYAAWGTCIGHERLPDGTFIHTSVVRRIESDSEGLHFFTQSGTHYICKAEDVLLEKLEGTKKSLLQMEADVSVLDNAVSRIDIRKTEKEREVLELLSENELYIEFLGDAVRYAFFKKDGSLISLECNCHVGMFHDSYLLRQYGIVDVRFFDNIFGIQFYHVSDGLRNMYVRHIGNDPFDISGLVKDMVFEPNDVSVKVIPVSMFKGGGLCSPDCVNGKSDLWDFVDEQEEDE